MDLLVGRSVFSFEVAGHQPARLYWDSIVAIFIRGSR